ncbi:MAG: ABC transporter ATP-binding protein [Planctomycetota bacterium]
MTQTENAQTAAAPVPADTAGDRVVIIENLVKDYRSMSGKLIVRALDNVGFGIRRGEVFGLLGPNGSGKTTTIKLLLGLLNPTSGKILALDRPPRDVAVKSKIGYLPEETWLYRYLTADETLDFFGSLFNLPKAVRLERADELIHRVGLDHARRRRLGEYSKGMARRLGLAQALINEPELVILDEPTSGLDPLGAREVKDLILRMKAEGKTVLLSSHLLADVQDVCDRIAILYRGVLRSIGTVSDLLADNDRVQFTCEGLNAEAISKIRGEIIASGGTSVNVGPPRERLEQYFLRIVAESEGRSSGKTPGTTDGGVDQ